MGLPREFFVHKTHNVISANITASAHSNARYSEPHPDGTYTVTTLGVKPLPDVIKRLRHRAAKRLQFEDRKWSSSQPLEDIKGNRVEDDHFELSATIRNATGPVGFTVRTSPNNEEVTTIIYDPAAKSIQVDRSKSSLIKLFNAATASGYYEAYSISCGSEVEKEDVDINIFVDGSLVEVFAGGRFALTTRVYPTRGDAKGVGVYVTRGASAELVDMRVWMGLGSVWPERPVDTSNTTTASG
jgi:beta-fructofuranosidase